MIKMAESSLAKIGRLVGTLERYSRDGARLLMEPVEPGTPDYDKNVREIYGAAERSARIANMHVSRRVAFPLILAGLAGTGLFVYDCLYGKRPESGVTTTPATSELPKTSSTKLATAVGRLCFDYNGNGKQDGEEPPVQKAKVQIVDKLSLITNPTQPKVVAEALTDSSGDYKVDIPVGSYRLYIKPDQTKPDSPKFRYMCTSPADLSSITDGDDLAVVGDGRFDIGLVEGPFILPFSSTVKYSIRRYYDWDSSPDTYRWWNNQQGFEVDLGYTESVNHIGVDFDIQRGENVLAPAPGISLGTQIGPKGQIELGIRHENLNLVSHFNHLSKVLVKEGQMISRGEIVALSGESGGGYPHLHYNIAKPLYGNVVEFYDFYAPVFNLSGSTNGYWAWDENGNQYWKEAEVGKNPNIGFWTARNKPYFYI
jgi:murein DD-endopeptidase MepM/ murein hydrolase activator NlpD